MKYIRDCCTSPCRHAGAPTLGLQLSKIISGFQRAEPFGRRRHPLLTNCAVVSFTSTTSNQPDSDQSKNFLGFPGLSSVRLGISRANGQGKITMVNAHLHKTFPPAVNPSVVPVVGPGTGLDWKHSQILNNTELLQHKNTTRLCPPIARLDQSGGNSRMPPTGP